jgi:hypothetical protein
MKTQGLLAIAAGSVTLLFGLAATADDSAFDRCYKACEDAFKACVKAQGDKSIQVCNDNFNRCTQSCSVAHH